MKKITLFLTMLGCIFIATSCSSSKKEFRINGEIDKALNIKSISLYNSSFEEIASAPVENGKFILKGSLDEPRRLFLGNEEAYYAFDIILENETYDLKVDERGVTYLTGGRIHQDVLGYQQNEDYIQMKIDNAKKMDEIFEGVDMENEEQVTKARNEMDQYGGDVAAYDKRENERVLEGDYPTLTKLFALFSTQDFQKYPVNKMIEMLNDYEKEIGAHPDLVYFRNMLKEGQEMEAMQESVGNGATFKEITGKDRDGNTVNLSDIIAKNEYTILEFWASWCGPCRAEIPNLKKAYKKYNAKGLEILSVSIDAEQSKWLAALDDEKPSWPNIVVENDFKNPGVAGYGVMGVPASFLISKDGIILANNQELREFELDRTLDKIINAKK